ncbi:MAG: hypothetical protein RI940_1298 [Bacteroidota bacterium]|jgi:hypothetical protein
MKKVILSALSILMFGYFVQAQNPTTPTKKLDLTGRASDHLMIQFGGDFLTGAPDSVKTSGFSRHFNVYFMYDKPFQKNQHYSVAFGAGIGSTNIFMDDHTYVNLKTSGNTLLFNQIGPNFDHFAKQKITTIYIQAPVELRYFSNPEHPGKSWKLAAGLKVGQLLKAYTKSKNYQTSTGSSIYGKTYIEKIDNKRFFNATDISLTGRVGYGIFSLDMGYLVNGYLRDGYGAAMNKVSVGLTISGL